MVKANTVSQERLELILTRQKMNLWGKDYIPAIMATRNEAPAISRPSILSSQKFGRDIHLLSVPERKAALLALYHPNLIELHEQKMLPTGPTPHPLDGHPSKIGESLPSMRGTVAVAEVLGFMDLHPKVSVPDPRDPEMKMWVPYPYLGDLLLFMEMNARTYCVNWTVKQNSEDFSRPRISAKRRINDQREAREAIARHQIEEVNYEDAGIRTIRVTEDSFDLNVISNLHILFGFSKTQLDINEEQRKEILDKFIVALDIGMQGLEVIHVLTERGQYSAHDCLTVFHQAIWDRILRVDLFSPILIDRPLKREKQDVIDVYSSFFKE
ncbi:MAG: PDDEXK family nuclease [Burkholderiales bacterium]